MFCPVAEGLGLCEGELTVIHSLSAPISSISTVTPEVGVVFPGITGWTTGVGHRGGPLWERVGVGELAELTLPKNPTNPHFMKMIIVKQ